MVRLTGGGLKGRAIQTTEGVRPTTGIVRESFFNMIRPDLVGASFLDLYAGSGLMGFEALSRGAHRVTAVDKDRGRLLAQNAQSLGVSDRHQVVRQDVLTFLKRPGQPFDIVFLDPPYGDPSLGAVIDALLTGGWVGGWCVLEHPKAEVWSQFPETRRFGDTVLSIIRPHPPQ
jgi:16S rRNA (guanine966-N2)-methyltransferase